MGDWLTKAPRSSTVLSDLLFFFWIAPGDRCPTMASTRRANPLRIASPRDAGRAVRHLRVLDRWTTHAHSRQARRVQYASLRTYSTTGGTHVICAPLSWMSAHSATIPL